MAYNNLGSAYIVKGEVYKAIGILKDVLKLQPDFPDALNNLGVAFFLAENSTKAVEYLNKANKLNTNYDAPIFNLGQIAIKEKKDAEAKKYWEKYLKLDSHSPWADLIKKKFSLKTIDKQKTSGEQKVKYTLGLEIGSFEDEIPSDWGKPVKIKEIAIEEEPFKACYYKNGLMVFLQDDEVLLIAALNGSSKKTSKGIGNKDTDESVADTYGSPSMVLYMTQGKTWIYSPLGIAFSFIDNKVSFWMMFEN